MEREPSFTSEPETTGKNKNKTTKSSPEQKPEATPRVTEADRRPEAVMPGSLWQRVVGELKAEDKPSKEVEATEAKEEKELPDTDREVEGEAAEEVPLESLSDSEGRVVASAAAKELDRQSAEHAPEVVEGTPQAEAEALAGQFRAAAVENLEAPDATSADSAIEDAYRDTLQETGMADAYEPYDSAPSPEADGSRAMDYEMQDPALEGPLDDDDSAVGAAYGAAGNGARQMSPPPGGRIDTYDSAYAWPAAESNPTYAEQSDDTFDRPAFAGGLVVGGVIGYLIGRRRGRIKTERQLLPVQKKLEAQVRAIERHLVTRENQIRALVQERAHQVPTEALLASAAASVPERPTAVPEQGRVATERPKEAVQVNLKSVETMTREEVLEASEQIRVGATTLRGLVETKLVSERGARRVLNEQRRGGDVKRVVAEELLITELGHELDPQLRDRPFKTAAATQGAGAGVTDATTQVGAAETAAPQPALKPARLTLNVRQQRPGQSALVLANVVALVVLGASIITLIIVWFIHQA